MKTRVILIEDHSDYRNSIRQLLDGHEKFTCVAAYSNVEDALSDISGGLEIDFILLDLGLPGMSGIEGIRCLRGCGFKGMIIVLTAFTDRQKVFAALEAGAHGYLIKSASVTRLGQMLSDIREGGAALDPQIAAMILETFRRLSPIADCETLSARECEVLQLSAKGMARKQIAEELNVSTHSITEYMRRIFDKLHVQSLPAAVSAAIRRGLLDLT